MTIEETSDTEWGGHLRLVSGSEEASNTDEMCTSDVYFSKQIFIALLNELEQCVKLFEKSTLSHHGNFFRRGNRLVRNGKALELEQPYEEDGMHLAPATNVYEYLEELIPFFKDTGHPDLAEVVVDLILNEVVSEVITTLMVRPGRQTSAAVLALHYGLVDEEDEAQVLENAGITADNVEKYLYAAHLDVDEIAQELNYGGDYKEVLKEARKRLE
jgi:hypothetical protein